MTLKTKRKHTTIKRSGLFARTLHMQSPYTSHAEVRERLQLLAKPHKMFSATYKVDLYGSHINKSSYKAIRVWKQIRQTYYMSHVEGDILIGEDRNVTVSAKVGLSIYPIILFSLCGLALLVFIFSFNSMSNGAKLINALPALVGFPFMIIWSHLIIRSTIEDIKLAVTNSRH